MTFRTLYPFFAVAFGLTWGLAALLLLFPAQIEGLFGPLSPSNPLYILAVYAPALAAIGLVIRHHGVRGLGAFFKRFTLWRLPLGYWLLLLLGIPALFYLGAAIKGSLGDPFPFFLGAIAITLLITAMFNASAGSLVFPVLFHFQTNGPMWPDAQPWDTLTFGIVAMLVVILNRKTMFARDAGVTTVVYDDRATEVSPAALRVGDVVMSPTRSARGSTR